MKNKYKNKIELVVRGVIKDKGKFLLCKTKYSDYYFFPGGHVEFGEELEEALIREIKEELGVRVTKTKLLGSMNNIYIQDDDIHHEVCFIYEIKVDKIHNLSQEDYLKFKFLSRALFQKEKVLPFALKKQLLKKSKQIFHITQNYK